jgi:CubicO group peptidase (beta-lactamase class C family)
MLGLKAQESIDAVVKAYMAANKIPGLSLALVQDDSLEVLKAYGFSSLQQEARVELNTTFELASLTKQFTASAILKLDQDGKLQLNDYLHQYFPECPDAWREIRIKHLLWHISGLPGMFPHDQFTEMSFTGYAQMSAEELDGMMQSNMVTKEVSIKSIITDQLDTAPGTAYNYSDVGYLLLGIVIDNITGDYRAYLSDIFEDYDMTSTYFVDQEKVIKNQARGYSLKDGEWINIMRTWDYEIPSYFGVYSNLGDLIKWQKVISGTNFLNEEHQGLLFTKGRLNDGSEVPYGCGWEMNDVNGLIFISHTGVTGTIMIDVPQKKTSLILLSNLGYNGHDMVNPWGLAYELLDLFGIETKINRNHITSNGLVQVKASRKIFTKFMGIYENVDHIEAKIYKENGKFYFESQGVKNELSLLEDGSCLVLGLDYEYILSLSKRGDELRSNYGRVFQRK